MKKYKGYYIDNVIFNNEAEIDDFIKKQEVDRYIKLNIIFLSCGTIEAADACSEQAFRLYNEFGLSLEEIEAFEMKAVTSYFVKKY